MMKKLFTVSLIVFLLMIFLSTISISAPLPKEPDTATKLKVIDSFGKLPLSFIENRGQINNLVSHYLKGRRGTIYFTRESIVYELLSEKVPLAKDRKSKKSRRLSFTLRPIGAEKTVKLLSQKGLPGRVNYLIGDDPKNWHTNIPLHKEIIYKGLYKGIDLKIYGTNNQMEYDFVLSPGADPKVITMACEGIADLSVDTKGNLLIETSLGDIKHLRPLIYQEIEGTRHLIDGAFRVTENTFSFDIGGYNKDYALIIDPLTLSYSTYLGGSGYDGSYNIAVDSSGAAYVAGYTTSTDFPTNNPYQGTYGGGDEDAFVAKLSPAGNTLTYSTYLGGSDDDSGNGIAVDSSGAAYVTGNTASTNFPTVNAYQGTLGGGDKDAFVAKLSPDGAGLAYSTYLGGSGWDWGSGIAVDSSGSAYITGTASTNFPTVNAYQETFGGVYYDAFVTKLSPAGNTLTYSTYLGGSGWDDGHSIAVDSSGSAYVTGDTASTDFPTTNAYQGTYGGGSYDAFVTKLNPDGASLAYSTYLGGSGWDWGSSIAVDSSGSAYVTGDTDSTDFPTNNAYQGTYGGGDEDIFVTKLSPSGNTLSYSTYLGGSLEDWGSGIALDSSENVYVTGVTASTNFPTVNAYQETYGGGYYDAFVTKLSSDGNTLSYSTYLGGSDYEDGNAIAVDSSGNAYVTGDTASTDFPTNNAYQGTYEEGFGDVFVTKFGVPQRHYWHVDGNISASGNGTTWDNAFKTIQAAIDAASKDDEIWLKKGTYEISSQINVDKTVSVYGGFAGDETQRNQRDWSGNVTTVDGQDSVYHCFYVTADATMDGLTITGGNADGNWPDYSGGGIYNYESSPTITNCTFSENSADNNGGGIYNHNNSSPNITNCTFSENSANNNGGGIYNRNNSSPTITNCAFSGNSAGQSGGGIYNYDNSSPTITNCTFSGNSAGWGGGIYNDINSSPTITNCTLSGNSAKNYGGGIENYTSSPTITNCTFWENSADFGGGICSFDQSSPTITNCIFWGDTATTDGPEIYNHDTSSPIVTYCDVQGGYGGVGNINADPLFVDPENDDFHLKITSPCIDKGSNSAPGIPNTDFEGDSRIVDGDSDGTATVDMGMDEYTFIDTDSDGLPDNWETTYFGDLSQGPDGDYDGDGATNLEEYQAGTDPANNPPTADAGSDQTVNEGDTVTLDGSSSSDPDDGIDSYQWTQTAGSSINLSDPTSSKPSFTAPSGGTLQFELKVTDKGGLFSTDTVIITVSTSVISNHVWHVDGNISASGNGTSWDKAFKTIQAAIDAAGKDDEIWLKKGTYEIPSQVNVDKAVAIYGGFTGGETQRNQRDWSGNVTTVDGQDSVYHCFYVTADATMDGLFITGGNADGNWPDSSGGGIFNDINSSPTITNCAFSGNSADNWGGGIFNDESSPTITNCTFLNNSTTNYHGGGIYNYISSPTITSCAFSGNSAGQSGGGIYNYDNSSPTITNCTFSGNSAGWGGGIYNDINSSPIITNCTLSGNSAKNYGGGIENYTSSPTITNCTFWENSADFGGGICSFDQSAPTITNCILWGDTATTDGPEIYNHDTSSPIVTYCDVQGGYVGEGNINADPLFVDPSNDDLYLQATSPCIDKGNNNAPGIPSNDFEGDPRIVDGDNDGTATVDMGADEYTGKNRPPTADAGPDQTVNEGDTVTLDGSSSSDPDDGIASYLWTRTDGPSVNLSDPTSPKPSFTAPSGGTLQFELKVTDKGGLTSIDTVTITITAPVISDGDVAPFGNRDGIVNVGDALVALRFALGLETPTQEDMGHGDVAPLGASGQPNPDGKVNVGDALVILRKALGIIDF